MTPGLAATAWATEGDETDEIVVIPGGDPGGWNYEEQKIYEIPFTKTVKLGGNTAPGETVFTIAVCHVNAHGLSAYTDVKYTVTVTTTGAGNYGGKLDVFRRGVALYGVSALLSLTGAALVIKRKNG